MASENPFAPAHSRSAFLLTSGCAEALRRLDEGLGEREPFLLVTGEAGVGKTAFATEALARWESRVTAAWLAYPALTGSEFLEEILRRFGAEPPEGASRSRLLAAFEAALAQVPEGRIATIVIDDAHALSLEHLEELRLLANAALRTRRPLEVLLLGLPALAARLEEPALAALRQRIAVRTMLEPLPPAETRRYLQHRVSAGGGDGATTFPKKTCREIASRTLGVPRQINALAAESLRVARAWGDRSVGVEHVQTAAAALGGFLPRVNVDDSEVEGGESPNVARAARESGGKPVPAVSPALPKSSTGAASSPASAPPAAAPAPVAVVRPAPPSAPEPAVAKSQSMPAREESASEPAATPREPAAGRAPRASEPVDEYPENPVTATHHDPNEWVKRFVGDKGPLQIASRARIEAGAWEEPIGGLETESTDAEAGAPRRAGARRHGRRGPGAARLVIVLVAALALIGIVVFLMRSGRLAWSHATGRVALTGAEPARRIDRPASLDGTRPIVTPAPVSPAETSPVPAPAPGGDATPVADVTGAKRPFTIDVGGQPDLDAALAARDRSSQLTGIRGWVVPGDGSGRPYRVVLGIFKSQERAAAAARMLVRSRTLEQATVVTLPSPRVRQ